MTEALETTGNQYLDLIREIVINPDVPVEKIQAMLEMQLRLEDRRAEQEFDAAMIAAQKRIEALAWDKFNATNQSRNVSYPKIERMIKPVREEFGFAQTFTTELSPNPNEMILVALVIHKAGHRRKYFLPMPIDPSGPKGGGVMTRPQAVSSGVSYGMRNLDKMIWNIPMLVDKDDNDGNEPYEKINEKQIADLRALADEVRIGKETGADVIKKMCDYFKIDQLENLPASVYQSAVLGMKKRAA